MPEASTSALKSHVENFPEAYTNVLRAICTDTFTTLILGTFWMLRPVKDQFSSHFDVHKRFQGIMI